jgi:hypothetical protein
MGARCLTASADGTAKAWGMTDGRQQWSMAGTGGTGATVAVSGACARAPGPNTVGAAFLARFPAGM